MAEIARGCRPAQGRPQEVYWAAETPPCSAEGHRIRLGTIVGETRPGRPGAKRAGPGGARANRDFAAR